MCTKLTVVSEQYVASCLPFFPVFVLRETKQIVAACQTFFPYCKQFLLQYLQTEDKEEVGLELSGDDKDTWLSDKLHEQPSPLDTLDRLRL